jgi:hypothetical protein
MLHSVRVMTGRHDVRSIALLRVEPVLPGSHQKGTVMTAVENVHGPIDFLLIEFENDLLHGETAGALLDLVERGIVRLWDIVVVSKADDGAITAFELQPGEELGGFGQFAGARSGLLSADDLDAAGEAMNPGTTAVLLVYENAWAVPFVAAALREGGTPIASARIPAVDVIAVLDELEAQS